MRTVLLLFCLLTTLGLGACATPYGIYEDERSLSTIVNDKALATAVKGRLLDENFGDGFSVSVYCFNAHAFLIGEVDPAFRAKAIEIAKATDKVQAVTAHWLNDAKSTTQDIALELDVAKALINAKGVSSTQVELVVRNGAVVILGIVENKEMATRIITIVKGVHGVLSVRSYLLY